ncbi:MAG: ion transporter [Notoacmeibacter sp.]|nr:ion transporter [Notoacmeibacter sp.]MCC0031861.1 ion transporter [Brucellaceae bacterium]
MQERIRELYDGGTRAARSFRWFLIAFDIATIAYFLATATEELTPTVLAVDMVVGVLILAEFLVRIWVHEERKRHLLSWHTAIDLIVIASFLAPLFLQNFAFLRVLRTLRFLQSFRLVHDLRQLWPGLAGREHVVTAATNLAVFIFIVTSLVWVLEARRNPGITNYEDALYFTITTLTTTGFGDITLQDRLGRWLTIGIMVFGVALFLRLVQQIFRPLKVRQTCRHCGLKWHDPDASHCKHCGNIMHIETDGDA